MMASEMPAGVETLLKAASAASKVANVEFRCQICNSPWDQFIEIWATRCYYFVAQALGPYQKEPLKTIIALPDGAHAGGANASFDPSSGQITLSASIVENKPGITLEKLTHELIHASLNDFPEGDTFYEEGFVDYSTWVMSHAPSWEPYRKQMMDAAAFNITLRRDRAMQDISDWDRKRWAGGAFAALAHGPHIVAKLRQRKFEGNLSW